jgi:ribonuclease HII
MPSLELEESYLPLIVAGVDEAGRGPLMGPVFAAALIVKPDHIIQGIDDSKKLSEARREELYEEIIKHYHYGIGSASALEIDEMNILEATKISCQRAIDNLPVSADIVLIDGNMKFDHQHYVSVVRGDQISHSIAAASIVAKVSRDRLVRELSVEFPEYGWERSKGYGTKAHIEAIRKHGLTKHHRKSFKLSS